MKSMTGYAKLQKTIGDYQISFEIKSYNNRYADIKIFVPADYSSLEPFIREYFSPKIARGSVEISLRISGTACTQDYEVNIETAEKYSKALQTLANNLGVDYTPDVTTISKMPGIITPSENTETVLLKNNLPDIFALAFSAFEQAKITEGTHCQQNIELQIKAIKAATEIIEKESGNYEQRCTETLTQRFQELVGQEYDKNRILSEVAVLLVKYTINEELVRLKTHTDRMSCEMQNDGPVAKRLDFIAQEMNREINTIAAKNTDYLISEQVIIIKEAVENIREQLKNLE